MSVVLDLVFINILYTGKNMQNVQQLILVLPFTCVPKKNHSTAPKGNNKDGQQHSKD